MEPGAVGGELSELHQLCADRWILMATRNLTVGCQPKTIVLVAVLNMSRDFCPLGIEFWIPLGGSVSCHWFSILFFGKYRLYARCRFGHSVLQTQAGPRSAEINSRASLTRAMVWKNPKPVISEKFSRPKWKATLGEASSVPHWSSAHFVAVTVRPSSNNTAISSVPLSEQCLRMVFMVLVGGCRRVARFDVVNLPSPLKPATHFPINRSIACGCRERIP